MQSSHVLSRASLSSSGSYSLESPQRHPGLSLENHDVRPASHYGIDEVVEDGADIFLQRQGSPGAVESEPQNFSGVTDANYPPCALENNAARDLNNVNSTSVHGVSVAGQGLIATIFYKDQGHYGAPTRSSELQHSGRVHAEQPQHSSIRVIHEMAEGTAFRRIPPNFAPTTLPTEFPLELPAEDPEPPRDGLYGTFVSPICIAAFLHLMSTFPHSVGNTVREFEHGIAASSYSGYGSDLMAGHRYLDNAAQPHVVEVTLSPVPTLDISDLRRHEQLYRFEREWNVEVILQVDTLWRRHPRLVVFDMDSTLIKQEVIDLLAKYVTPEVSARVAEITHRAMGGDLQFEEAFRERVRLLAGLPSSLFDSLRSHLEVTDGVRPLLRALRRLGIRTAVLSGGFQPLTEWLAKELGINHAYANHVCIDKNGRLTGEVQGVIVGRERKCELLKQIAADEHIDLRQTVAVGDGANDLFMLKTAGLGVAWHAKPVVQLKAHARLNRPSLLDLLYLFGYTSTEIAELIAD